MQPIAVPPLLGEVRRGLFFKQKKLALNGKFFYMICLHIPIPFRSFSRPASGMVDINWI